MTKYKAVITNNKKGFIVMINPIGDDKYGYLHWDGFKQFKNKKDALAFKKKLESGDYIIAKRRN